MYRPGLYGFLQHSCYLYLTKMCLLYDESIVLMKRFTCVCENNYMVYMNKILRSNSVPVLFLLFGPMQCKPVFFLFLFCLRDSTVFCDGGSRNIKKKLEM